MSGRSRARSGWLWRPLLGATLSQVVLGIVRPTASYAGLDLGADAALIGVIAASFAIVPMVVALPVGALAGRLRRIGIVPALAAILLVIACALAAQSKSIGALVAASALVGVANLGILVGAQAWITRSAPPERYTGGFGWMTAGMALGQGIGPLVAGMAIDSTAGDVARGTAQAFWIAAGAAAALFVVFVSPAARSYDDQRAAPAGSLAILRTPGVLRYVVVSAAVLTSVDILTAYLPLVGTQHGISPVLVGAMLAVRGIASMLSRVLLGPLGRRFDASGLIVVSLVGTAMSMLVVALVPVTWVLFAVMVVGGFFLGMGQPLTMTAVAVVLPARDRASGLALRLLGNRIAQTAAPLLAGAVAAGVGLAGVFLLQVVGLAVSAVWEISAHRR